MNVLAGLAVATIIACALALYAIAWHDDLSRNNPCQAHFALAQLASGERVCVLLPPPSEGTEP